MPQSLSRVIVHIIFSTKNRAPILSTNVRPELFAYMAGILKKHESPGILIGGAEDHLHVLCLLSKNYAPKKIVEEIKKGSSKWIKTQDSQFASFAWQRGYGVFSVSQSRLKAVMRYIDGQQEHHRRVSFQDEFRAFLKRCQVPYDERYVWD